MLGFDLNNSVYISVANGMQMFNLDEVVEINVFSDSVQVVTWWAARSGLIRSKLSMPHNGPLGKACVLDY
ncbi:MAG: hypothetical protein H0X47_11865 [Nitrospirales bacterium]|nr:hypothetical protein [Nitrospirales bacterium]